MGMFGNVDYYNGQALGPTNQGPMLGASGGNQPPQGQGGAYLDVSQLQPLGSPTPDGGGGGDTPTYTQRFNSPAGPIIATLDANQQPTGYMVGDPNGKMVTFDAQGGYRNSFEPGKGSFWEDFKGNVLEDKNFLMFASLVAGGALAGAYAGGAGTAAGVTEAGIVNSAGFAEAGLVADGATAAAAGGAAASPYLTAAGPAGFLSSAAGAGAAQQAGQLGAPAAAAGGAGAAAQQGWLSNSTGIPQNVLDGLGGLGSGLFDLWNRNQMSNRQDAAVDQANANTREAGNRASRDILGAGERASAGVLDAAGNASRDMLGAGERAASLAGFTPYNISGGLTGVQVGPNGSVNQTMDPRLRGIQDQQLSGASGFFGSVNSGSPAEQSKAAYQNYLNWAKPAQEQQFAALQDRMAKQGLLGLQVGTQGVAPVTQAGGPTLYAGGSANSAAQYAGATPGQPTTVNPYYKDFAQGIALADLKNYENSIRFGQETTANQMSLGQGMLNGAMSIDKLGQETLNQSRQFGDSRAAAGARQGGFLTDAARSSGGFLTDAARNSGNYLVDSTRESGRYLIDANRQAGERTFDRANESASQDAMRNRSIWDAIWNNVL